MTDRISLKRTKTFVLVIGHRGRAIKTSSGAIIYLRCDYNYNAVKAFSMIGKHTDIRIDLGGHTLTDNSSHNYGLLCSSKKESTDTVISETPLRVSRYFKGGMPNIALGKKITVENLRFFALFSLSEVSRRIWQSS